MSFVILIRVGRPFAVGRGRLAAASEKNRRKVTLSLVGLHPSIPIPSLSRSLLHSFPSLVIPTKCPRRVGRGGGTC